ncbi:MAG: MFS transporter [Ilumatobacteraceae bacterium]|jgi:MFS family permease
MDRRPSRMPRAYWRLLSASSVSNVGDGVLVGALPLLAARATDSELSVGLMSAFFTLPWLFLSLPAGAVVDRANPRRVMVLADLSRAALVAGLAVAAATTEVDVWMLWVLALGLGVGEVFFDSASQAIVPLVVDGDRLERANGWRFSAELVGNTFIGMPLGSILFAAAVWLPFGIDAASFAVAALLVATLPSRRRASESQHDTEEPGQTSIASEIADGLRWLRSHGLLRDLAIALAVANLAFAMVESTFVLYLTREIGIDERLFGVTVAVMGIGGTVAGLVAGRVVDGIGRRWTIVAVATLPVLVMALLAGATDPWIVVGLVTAQAMLVTVWSVTSLSLRQQLVPEHLFGRVNGVYRWLSWGAMPVGAVAGGAIAQATSLRGPYVTAAWLLGASALLVLARVVPFVPERPDEA